jgi:hypothetical protein
LNALIEASQQSQRVTPPLRLSSPAVAVEVFS